MSSKKDSLAHSLSAGAGELAANLFDKLTKKTSSSNDPNTAANLISTFANNIQKNILNHQKPKNMALSRLLSETDPIESNPNQKSSLIIYDDDLDDSELNSELKVSLQNSQSDFNISSKSKGMAPSISLSTSLSTTSTDDKSEPDALRKRILTKKNSIELSLEDVPSKPKPALTTGSLPTTPATPTIIESIQIKSQESVQSVFTETSSVENVQVVSDPDPVALPPNAQNEPRLIPIIVIGSIFVFLLLIPKQLSFTFLTYLFGFTNGLALSALLVYLSFKFDLIKYFMGTNTSAFKHENTADPTRQMQSLLIQSAVKKENKNFDGVYRSWMNELGEVYDPKRYFLNKTRSVYVSLDGVMLRLQTTSSHVPKRAVPGEHIRTVSFNEQRIYDLTDCEVSILPIELCRKRYWSKKYPICLKGVKLLSHKDSDLNLSESDSSNTLTLFGRTDREKEEWFNLFKKSSTRKLLDSSHYNKQASNTGLKTQPQSSIVSPVKVDSVLNLKYSVSNEKIIYRLEDSESKVSPNTSISTDLSNAQESKNASKATETEDGLLYDSSLTFMNTFLIRIFADFFNHKQWINQIQTKIQNKLNKIKVPYFMEDLKITGIDLGSVVPLIKQASEPWYDEKGLWVHLDIDYSGSIQMSLATKLNLMKLKSDSTTTPSSSPSLSTNNSIFSFKNDNSDEGSLNIVQQTGSVASSSKSSSKSNKKEKNLAIENSDEEDSPESSGDEYVHAGFNDDENKLVETANPSKKLLNIVNKIAASNYFQKATEYKYIKKAMENVSNCQLLLTVEVKKITGKIALNIPPHPSDRIWYGFVSKPDMALVATPQVGEKEVSYSAISDFIADKLKLEFQKVLVFPNMDDFYIPILNSEVDTPNY